MGCEHWLRNTLTILMLVGAECKWVGSTLSRHLLLIGIWSIVPTNASVISTVEGTVWGEKSMRELRIILGTVR